jgi:hypothetical protein
MTNIKQNTNDRVIKDINKTVLSHLNIFRFIYNFFWYIDKMTKPSYTHIHKVKWLGIEPRSWISNLTISAFSGSWTMTFKQIYLQFYYTKKLIWLQVIHSRTKIIVYPYIFSYSFSIFL